MRPTLALCLLASLAVAACAPADTVPASATPLDEVPASPPTDTTQRASPGASTAGSVEPVAVVELFTSEGCSSCPPADRLLAEIAAEADSSGQRVIALAFHVDYWDGLGWADPYGSPAYTARQRAYAAAGDGRVYTPQMVVRGAAGFVGSRASEARTRIAESLSTPTTVAVGLAARAVGRSVEVEYDVSGAPSGARLHVALVQDATQTDVERGENRGRRLQHVRVVRAFTTVPARAGTAALPIPDGVEASGTHVVGYVQPGDVGRVLGASQVRPGENSLR